MHRITWEIIVEAHLNHSTVTLESSSRKYQPESRKPVLETQDFHAITKQCCFNYFVNFRTVTSITSFFCSVHGIPQKCNGHGHNDITLTA